MKIFKIPLSAVLLALLLLPAWLQAAEFIGSAAFSGKNGIAAAFAVPVDKAQYHRLREQAVAAGRAAE